MAVDVTLSEAMSEYVTGVAAEHRPAVARELQRFGRWFGSDRPVRTVTRLDLERYQAQQEDNGSGNSTRLEPLKDFFTFARKKKFLDEAVATALRIKRRSNSTAGSRMDTDRSQEPTVQLTRAGLEQLQTQLDKLDNVERPAAEHELQLAAADKDFRENAPYDAAKQHLAEIHRKMSEIKTTIAAGQVVETTNSTRVGIGSTVVVADLEEEDEEITYTLVGPGEIDARKGKISIQSPVGRALDLRAVGDIVEVDVPAGVVRYKILRIELGS
jgi:transcription elongation factor GreA